jgi:hypothetical protein
MQAVFEESFVNDGFGANIIDEVREATLPRVEQ